MEEYNAPTIVRYCMESSNNGKKFTSNLFIVRAKDGQKIVFVSNYPYYYESIIAEKYKKRWGIETSYRVKSELRLKTCSRKYVVSSLCLSCPCCCTTLGCS